MKMKMKMMTQIYLQYLHLILFIYLYFFIHVSLIEENHMRNKTHERLLMVDEKFPAFDIYCIHQLIPVCSLRCCSRET